MEKLARDIAEKLVDDDIIDSGKQDAFRYGAEIILSAGSFCLVSLLIGLLLGRADQVVVFLLSFFPLRCFVGGYHADTPEKCLLVSLAVTVLCLIGGPTLAKTIGFYLVALSVGILWFCAPGVHPDSPQSDLPLKVLKLRARCAVSLEAIVFMLLWLQNSMEIAGIMAMTFAVVAASVWFPNKYH